MTWLPLPALDVRPKGARQPPRTSTHYRAVMSEAREVIDILVGKDDDVAAINSVLD
jgi:hypothetical protein